MSDDCLFCKIANQEIPSKKAYEDDSVYAFHDINPAAPTHILLIPRKHIATLDDLEPEDEPLMGSLFTIASKLAVESGNAAKGYRTVFNCGAGGGQTVFHVHLHLLAGRPFKWPPG